MTHPPRLSPVAALALASLLARPAPAQIDPHAPLDAARRAEIVEAIADVYLEQYVHADVAQKLHDHLVTTLEAGGYDDATTLRALVPALSNDVRAVSRDLHLRILPLRPPDDASRLHDQAYDDAHPDLDAQARLAARAAFDNFGFAAVRVLPGNVGYLEMTRHEDPAVAGATAVRAMQFLAHCDALVLDLRRDGGGYSEMTALLASYLIEEPTKLVEFRTRRDDSRRELWSHYVPGPRLTRVPVAVLTSADSFSAAEELAYVLQVHRGATVVGEATRGGGNAIDFIDRPNLGVTVKVSISNAIYPKTGADLEGVGVTPDVAVAADRALDAGCAEVLAALFEASKGTDLGYVHAFHLRRARGRVAPAVLDAAGRRAYVGTYAGRGSRMRLVIEESNDGLVATIPGMATMTMTPLERDHFELSDEMGAVNLSFSRNDAGAIVGATANRVSGMTANGIVFERDS